MQREFFHRWTISEISLSVFVLFLLLFFNYGILVRYPYSGFHFDPMSGRIVGIYVDHDDEPSLQIGDRLISIDSVSWEDYYENGRQPFFEGRQAGETVEIIVTRGENQIIIPWKIRGVTPSEFNKRFFNVWWLSYAYWIFGTAAQLLMRPRTTVRQLLVAANYLTAFWLMVGAMSESHMWESSILLHAVTWLLLPVYLHLHWSFPAPLRILPKSVFPFFYSSSALLAIAEIFQILPRGLYAVSFLLAMLGSMFLLITHYVNRPNQRREVGFLLTATLLVVIPLISFSISGIDSKIAPIVFLALPFMPLAYFYAVYRRQLGGMEIRANRLISIYAFLILLGSLLLLLFQPARFISFSREMEIVAIISVAILTVFVSILVFPSFQSFLEQRFLNVKLPYGNLQETYSSRIAITTSANDLLQLLENEVFPSLLIRQYAFVQASNEHLKILLTKNVSANTLPVENETNQLLKRSGKYISNFSSADEWIRLILPLKAGDSLIGFWLLGRRDPDDFYPLAEIPILQSLASQTAIALSNITHREQLLKMYQVDVERSEQERKKLSLDLHDSILNQLALLRRNLDESSISPKFQDAYQELVNRLREIVSDLRPPLLIYGLKPAIEELADNLMERSDDKVKINVDLEASEERIPQQIELHIFRIVQEAFENCLRHANAKTISIHGNLTQTEVSLDIQDDGKGFEKEAKLELDDLLMNRHFGLAGMIERAYLIGATIQIDTNQKPGTHIHIAWADRA